jgi:hypothetical protein
VALVLPCDAIMEKNSQQDLTPVLQWVFWRDGRAITCEIDATRRRGFEVLLVPHWDRSASVIERFDAVHQAFLRHAEMAQRLRESGWVRAVAHRAGDSTRIAA